MATSVKKPGQNTGGALRRYATAFRSPRGMAGAILLALLALVSVLSPLLFPAGYDDQSNVALAGPSAAHWLGTDELGRDILARTIYGLRTDLSLLLTAVPLSAAIGTLLGLAGVLARWLGAATQRVLDVILGFPGLLLGMTIVLVIGTGWLALFVSLLVVGLPSFGRLARAGLLVEQEREYVLAARVLGVPRRTVLTRHVLPNILDPIVVNAAVYMVVGIFIEAGLSIVGLGIKPPIPSLGAMLNTGARYVEAHPAYVLGPGLVLLMLALALTLLSNALNKAVLRK
ncbi:peptide/nickel transport system permease protein [Kibdelosporangium banguiense]|uniref:Peptide/nickel transport system permease protein n=1 Tax=Kibdelosporangium banguiense TaxID=1365924 RepID=A0ABS4TRB7_9PSEU|nr:ABC transporter permease [Kibdelosporangium banguiense]MBP2326946.1 peptide/nickel transport system permease protein [Kibdelosporangium banguiense]